MRGHFGKEEPTSIVGVNRQKVAYIKYLSMLMRETIIQALYETRKWYRALQEPHLWKSTMVEARFIGQVHMTRNKPEILTAQENRLPRCVTFLRIVLCASVVLSQEFHVHYLGPFSRETIGLDCPILS